MEATLVWGAEPKVWVVGPALERLEAICPGLGAIVLSTIESQGWLSLPVFTPWEGLGVAQYLYWYGEDNEEMAVEEHCGEDQEAREAMLDTMVTRATVSAAFPAWAIKHGNDRKALGIRRVRRIAEAAVSAKVRRVAQATLALRELALDRRFVPEVEGDFTGHVAILTWAREPHDDLLLRIYDDFNELACQAEHYDWCGEQQFDLGKPEQFAEWATAMQPRFEAIRLLDTLIHELATGDWSRTPKGIA
jgi:PRTRC genetic system protein F